MVSLDIDRILGFPAFGQLMLNVRQRGRVKGFQILNGRELSVLRLFIGSELEHDREVRPVRLDSQIEHRFVVELVSLVNHTWAPSH